MPDVSYSSRQLSRVLRLRTGQMRRWQRSGLFPQRQSYGWAELVRARALHQMEAAAVSSRRLRCSLRSVRERVPELADPLLEVAWRVCGGRVEILHRGHYMDALTGQMRLPFPGRLPCPEPQPQLDAEYWFVSGLALEQEPDQAQQAMSAYQRCLELDPTFASAHINLGTLHYHGKAFAAAERCYRAALMLDPDYALAHFNLGNVLDETGRLEEAVGAYQNAVRLAPTYADAHYNLALALQRLGWRRRAVPHWRHYLELDRGSPWAAHARAQLKDTIARDRLKLVKKNSGAA